MVDSVHRSEIEIVANDSKAHQALDAMVKKLEHIQTLSKGISFGGGGAGGAGGGFGGGPEVAAQMAADREQRQAFRDENKETTAQREQKREQSRLENSAASQAAEAERAAHEQRQRATRTGVAGVSGVAGAVTSGGPAMGLNAASSALGTGAYAVGGMAGAGMAVAALGLVAAGKGASLRYGRAGEAAGLEHERYMARSAGMDLGLESPYMAHAVKDMGFSSQAATSMASSYGRSIGMTNTDYAMDPFKLSLMGVDTGAAARFQSLASRGGGAGGSGYSGLGVAGTLEATYATGRKQFGFSGQKLDELVGHIANAVTGMAERGLDLNPESMLRMASSLDRTSESFAGMKGARGAGNLASLGADTAAGMLGQFQGLSQAALLAQAAKGGGSALDIFGRMQKFTMEESRDAINQQLHGGEASALGFAGTGRYSVDQARALSGALADPTISRDVPDVDKSALSLSRTQEGGNLALLQDAVANPQQVKDMFRGVRAIEGLLMAISDKLGY